VIAVGALDRNGTRLGFSNFGDRVSVYTYGSGILTTCRGAQKYARFSGTSASAAIVSGVIALYLSQDHDMTLTDIREKLASTFKHGELYDTK
jgi:subtilisin family serine protease